MASLFEPLSLGSVRLRNRIALSPMCQYSARKGYAGEWHLRHYAERAIGGAGLVVVEATAVQPDGRITLGDLGIWDDRRAEALAKIARAIKAGGAAAGIQLAHAGRKASTGLPWEGALWLPPQDGGWQTRGPSAIAFGPGYPAPAALEKEAIGELVSAFASAAQRAQAAGFELVELHSAHGYLLHQFLSPLSNTRVDEYGGDLEGRLRLPLEVAAALRSVLPSGFPIVVRISATDWVEGGWDLESAIEYSRRLMRLGVDLIDVSSGGLVPYARPTLGPMYQVPFARAIRERAGVATGAVGLITGIEEASLVIADGSADLVSLGRLLLRDPYWPQRNAPPGFQRPPLQYLRAFPS